jgi:hypothetical protein
MVVGAATLFRGCGAGVPQPLFRIDNRIEAVQELPYKSWLSRNMYMFDNRGQCSIASSAPRSRPPGRFLHFGHRDNKSPISSM